MKRPDTTARKLTLAYKCPFCGGDADVYEDTYINEWFAECPPSKGPELCPAMVCVGPYPTREEAVAAWNRRPDHRPLPACVYDLFTARRDVIAATKAFPAERPTRKDIERAKKQTLEAKRRYDDAFEQLRVMAEEAGR